MLQEHHGWAAVVLPRLPDAGVPHAQGCRPPAQCCQPGRHRCCGEQTPIYQISWSIALHTSALFGDSHTCCRARMSLQGLHPVTPALKASNRALHKRKGAGRQSSTNRKRSSSSHGVGRAGFATQASPGLDALLAAGSAAAAERVRLLPSACHLLFLCIDISGVLCARAAQIQVLSLGEGCSPCFAGYRAQENNGLQLWPQTRRHPSNTIRCCSTDPAGVTASHGGPVYHSRSGCIEALLHAGIEPCSAMRAQMCNTNAPAAA